MLTLYKIFGSTLCSQYSVTLAPFSTYFLTTKRASISEYPSKKRKNREERHVYNLKMNA